MVWREDIKESNEKRKLQQPHLTAKKQTITNMNLSISQDEILLKMLVYAIHWKHLQLYFVGILKNIYIAFILPKTVMVMDRKLIRCSVGDTRQGESKAGIAGIMPLPESSCIRPHVVYTTELQPNWASNRFCQGTKKKFFCFFFT